MIRPQCPKCKFYADDYDAPLGKIITNPYAAEKYWYNFMDCGACNGTGYIPKAVIDSIVNFAKSPEDAEKIVSELRWSMDHFSFIRHGMYVGVEVDGYLHT